MHTRWTTEKLECRRMLASLGMGGILTLGIWFFTLPHNRAKADQSPDSSKPRVFELRTYTPHPDKLQPLQQRFRKHTHALLKKHEVDVVGYWVKPGESEGEQTLVCLLAHADQTAAQKAWKAFRSDPAWTKVLADTRQDGPLVKKVESVFLKPTDFSPLR